MMFALSYGAKIGRSAWIAGLALAVPFACRGGDDASPERSWPAGLVSYSVLVRSFFDSDGDGQGDLAGLSAKLDALNDGRAGGDDLGIDVLTLMPLSPAVDVLGYQSVNLRAVDPTLGTEEDVRSLVAAAHARSMRVVVEVPLVQVSAAHPWFMAAISDPADPAHDRFLWRDANPGWTVPWAGLRAETWHPTDRGDFYYGPFGAQLPVLDVRHPDVRRELRDIAVYWLDLGVDGIKVIAAGFAVPTGPADGQWHGEETVSFWAAFARDLAEEYPGVKLTLDLVGDPFVGERYLEADPSLLVTAPAFGEATTTAVQKQRATPVRVDVGGRASTGYVLALEGSSRPRVGETLRAPHQARSALVLQMTLPGSPELFYGQELGFGHNRAIADVSRFVPFAWDPTPPRFGFTSGDQVWNGFAENVATANLETQRDEPGSIFELTRTLIALRRAHPALARGTYESLMTGDHVAPVMAFLRQLDGERVVVAVNLALRPAGVGPVAGGRSSSVLWGTAGVGPASVRDGGLQFALPPHAAGIWRIEP